MSSISAGSVQQDVRVGRGVILWLILMAGLIMAMVVVGGATRLTDSGLSITEWQPITGAIPPLSEADWLEAFEKYKQIPEYSQINEGMSLDAFKSIFWWEWAHRFLGRFIGVAFAVPFLLFWFAGRIPDWLKPRLAVIFLLGGAQGALGWYMVKSGLVDRVDVSQYRLAAHLGLAVAIFGYIVWTVLTAVGIRRADIARPGSGFAWVLMILVFAQILLGGLVAGLDAGLTYATWPLMDGHIVPSDLFIMQPWQINFFENVKTVQFDHRMLAYAIWALALIHFAWLWRGRRDGTSTAMLVFAAVTAQAFIGVATLVSLVPLGLALTHQAGALIVLVAALVHCATLSARPHYLPG